MASIDTTDNNSFNTQSLPENRFAALDIGSNSFHFIYARVVDENIQILHSEKYRVKLAQGLDDNDELDDNAITRGIEALNNITNITGKLTRENFRVVATFTLRQAKNAKKFIEAAAKVFPFDIELISGHEEARLIYQGVAHHTPPEIQRLIIDIGGGSTECVIGKNLQTKHLTSLNIGCVSMAKRHFKTGQLTKSAFKNAILDVKQEIEGHVKRFKKAGWQQVLGTSGTIKSIYNIVNARREPPQVVTFAELIALKKQLIGYQNVDNINISALKENRRHILAPGLAVLIGVCEMLDIEGIDYCDYSLREGVLSEQLEQARSEQTANLAQQTYEDVRDRTINSLATRFNVDEHQVNNVQAITEKFIAHANSPWRLNNKVYKKLLFWAVQIHEIGFDINPSGHHKHAKYIILNADLAGFNIEQQQALAWLVGNQRKKVQLDDSQFGYLLNEQAILKLGAILRLSILLGQQRQLTEQISFNIKISIDEIMLTFTKEWLDEHTLFAADLIQEQKQLQTLNINLKFC